jgi:hypothetical protein
MAAVTCQEIRDLFSARADDALTAEERAALDAHLRTCADCAREWQRFAVTVSLLRAAEPARAPAGFVDRVLAARPQPWYRRLVRTILVPWPVKLPLEAAAVVLVAGLAVVIVQRSDLQQAAFAPETPVTVRGLESPGAPPPAPVAPPAARQESAPLGASADSSSEGTARGQGLGLPKERRAKSTTSDPAEPLSDSRADQSDRERTEPPMMGLEPSRGAAGTAAPAAPEAKREAAAERPARHAPVPGSPRSSQGAALERYAPPPASAVPGQQSVQVEGLGLRRDALITAAGQVEARLAAPDRAVAEREIRVLIARLGGVVTARGESLEIVVPRDAWDELAGEMARIGTLRIDRRPPDLPSAVRMTLRLE